MTKRQFFIFTLIPFFIATTASAQVTFTNVTAEMGIDKIGRGGAVWGDYDNDGDADMLLGNRYPHRGNHIIEAVLVGGDGIQVAFDDNRLVMLFDSLAG